MTKIKVGPVAHLENGGEGLVFNIKLIDHPAGMPEIPTFAVRYQDHIRVFKNICGHIAVNLDFKPGQFFDEEGENIICSTHDAHYSPETGKCLSGPCFGVGLEKLEAIEEKGVLFITDQAVDQVILIKSP